MTLIFLDNGQLMNEKGERETRGHGGMLGVMDAIALHPLRPKPQEDIWTQDLSHVGEPINVKGVLILCHNRGECLIETKWYERKGLHAQ